MVSTESIRRPRQRLGRSPGRFGRPVWAPLLGIATVLVAWQLVYLSGWKPTFILPSPATVLTELWAQAQHPVLWQAVWTTMGRALLGFGKHAGAET